jgi:hypothetical protein
MSKVKLPQGRLDSIYAEFVQKVNDYQWRTSKGVAVMKTTFAEIHKNMLRYKKPARWIGAAAIIAVIAATVGFAADRARESLPWTDLAPRNDWPVHAMAFDRITFGSDREQIVYRMGRGPDAEDAENARNAEDTPAGERILYYHEPPVMYTPPEGGAPREVPGSAYDVTFYIDGEDCVNKKQLYGVYRIDIAGGNAAVFEMTAGEGGGGRLSDVLDQYGGPDAVEREGDSYILWYRRPDDPDKRMWFEVKDGELTYRMGTVCLCEGGGVGAEEAAEQLAGSLAYADGNIRFQIPPRYYKPYEWNIHIAGRAESPLEFPASPGLPPGYSDSPDRFPTVPLDDPAAGSLNELMPRPLDEFPPGGVRGGFSRSVHELEDENERRNWEAGKWYSIPVEGRNLTELTMDVFLPDENGSLIEKSIDLLAAALELASADGADQQDSPPHSRGNEFLIPLSEK